MCETPKVSQIETLVLCIILLFSNALVGRKMIIIFPISAQLTCFFIGRSACIFRTLSTFEFVFCLDTWSATSSVARGGGGGGSSPPHWLVKYAKLHVFCAFEADFLWEMENSPPHSKRAPPQTFEHAKLEEKSPWILAKTFFFWRSPDFGRKKRLNFGFRPKNHSEFWRRPFFFFFLEITWYWAEKTFEFWISAEKSLWILAKTFFFFFGDHLILGGKNVFGQTFQTFRLKFWTNRLKLIQRQWKFESRSFAHFSLFQNSPPLFQILATRLSATYN